MYGVTFHDLRRAKRTTGRPEPPIEHLQSNVFIDVTYCMVWGDGSCHEVDCPTSNAQVRKGKTQCPDPCSTDRRANAPKAVARSDIIIRSQAPPRELSGSST